MGGKNSKKNANPELTEPEIEFLLNNTKFDRDGIIRWYSDFLVRPRRIIFLDTCNF